MRKLLVLCTLWTALGAAGTAHAQEAAPLPPVITARYVQYGIGLFTEALLAPGDVCSDVLNPCIIGSGAGIALRGGYRPTERWYIGGAYAFSRQDASNLIRLPILQQLRAEGRWYLSQGTALSPYVSAEIGVALYGNEWTADTWGPSTALGLGLVYQVGRRTVIGGALYYRPMFLRRWTDQAGTERAAGELDFGVVHFLSLEVTIELKTQVRGW